MTLKGEEIDIFWLSRVIVLKQKLISFKSEVFAADSMHVLDRKAEMETHMEIVKEVFEFRVDDGSYMVSVVVNFIDRLGLLNLSLALFIV